MYKIVAEIIGYAAVLSGFVMFQQTERKRLIICKLIIDVLWIIHFLMLGGYTIVFTTSICVVREIVFVNRDKGIFKHNIWLLVFVLIYAVIPIFTREGIYSIFPVISSIAATVSLWINSIKRTKLISLFVCLSQIIYSVSRNSYSAVTNELVTITSILISFLRGRKNERIVHKSKTDLGKR